MKVGFVPLQESPIALAAGFSSLFILSPALWKAEIENLTPPNLKFL